MRPRKFSQGSQKNALGASRTHGPLFSISAAKDGVTYSMASEALIGFVGVLLGSSSTAMLTVYRERLVSRRERDARQHQREQEREDRRNAFQRESILGLQDAVSDLLSALFEEQDRQLKQMDRTNKWPAREWETQTAIGWQDAEFRLQISKARVFDKNFRNLAGEIRRLAMQSIWASSIDEAKVLNIPLEQKHERFNDMVADSLPELY